MRPWSNHRLTVPEAWPACRALPASATSSCSSTAPSAWSCTRRAAPIPRRHTPGTRSTSWCRGAGSSGTETPGIRFGPGDLLFVPAGVVHRFEEFTDDLAVWVVFYGPEGGEASAVSAARAHAAPRLLPLRPHLRAGAGADLLPGVVLRRPGGGAAEPGRLPGAGRGRARASSWCAPGRADSPRTTTSAATAARSWCPTASEAHFSGGIRCPYHSWTYTLDGALRTAPFLEESDGLAKGDLSLHPVGVDTWGGFVFVNLRPEEARAAGHSLAGQLAGVPERLRRYPLAELRVARRIEYSVAANWKVMLENYNECYHCGPVHPELCRLVPAFKQRGGADLDWERGIPHRDGAWTFTDSGTTTRGAVRRLERGRARPAQG